MPTGFQQVTRHSVAKGNPNVLKCLKQEPGEGTLHAPNFTGPSLSLAGVL